MSSAITPIQLEASHWDLLSEEAGIVWATRPVCHPAAQNEQWRAAAKSVVTFDCNGTSDSTLVPLNDGQGSACVDGLPPAAKLAQSVRMLAASACGRD